MCNLLACFLAADVCTVVGRVIPLNIAMPRCVTIFTTKGYLLISVGSSLVLAVLIMNAVCERIRFILPQHILVL